MGADDPSMSDALEFARPYRQYNIYETYPEAIVEVRAYCLKALQVTHPSTRCPPTYALHSTPYALHIMPYTRAAHTQHPTARTYNLNPKLHTLHPTPQTPNPTPHTLHPWPSTSCR